MLDPLGNRIGEDVARIAARAPPGSVFGVVDPFAGSCNGLFWILRHLPGVEGLGFEFEQAIFDMSARNIELLGASIKWCTAITANCSANTASLEPTTSWYF